MSGLIQILGGLALFMFGIRLLSSGMEKLAGENIQRWLSKVVDGRLRSAAFGTVASAFLQSSGLLMVTMIGLINANLMTVQQSIGIMLGQEIGTTVTAQIVVFDIGAFRLLLVIFGFAFLEYFDNRDWKKYGEIMMGLGLIFVGMTYMKNSLDDLLKIPYFAQLLVTMGQRPMVGILAGLIVTAITQSSTAVTSMAVAMGMKSRCRARSASSSAPTSARVSPALSPPWVSRARRARHRSRRFSSTSSACSSSCPSFSSTATWLPRLPTTFRARLPMRTPSSTWW